MRKNSLSAPQYGVSGAGRMAGNLRATKGTVSTLDNGGFKVSRKSSLADHQHGSPKGKHFAALKEEGRTQHATAQPHEEAAPPVVLDMSELYPNRGSVRLSKKKGQEKESGKGKLYRRKQPAALLKRSTRAQACHSIPIHH